MQRSMVAVSRPAFLVALCLGFLLVCAAPAEAQSTTRRSSDPTPRVYSLRGSVRYAQNETPADMIKVELKRFSGETVSVTFTRNNGEFEFVGLANGEYTISIDLDDFEPVRENVQVMNGSRMGLFVYLKKPVGFTMGQPGNIVSARELGLPRKATSAYHKGEDLLYEKKNAAASLPHFQRALVEHPAYYEAYHLMGVAYMEMGRPADAMEAFRKSIELSEQRYPHPHFALAAVLSTDKQYGEAAALARRGIELDAAAWQGHYELARALFGLNRLDEAQKSVQDTRRLRADFAPVYLLSANISMRRRDGAALLRDLDDYLRLEPNGPMSAQARQMRDSVQKSMAQAQQQKP